MRAVTKFTATVLMAAVVLAAAAPMVAQMTTGQVARLLAENNQGLRCYSWTLRVELTNEGETQSSLYKVRYDLDGKFQATPDELDRRLASMPLAESWSRARASDWWTSHLNVTESSCEETCARDV